MMRTLWQAAILGVPLALAACASGGAKTDAAPAAPVQTAAPVRAPAAAAAPVAQPALPADPLKDPASPLARRSVFYAYDQYDVPADYRALVEAHARYLRDHPAAKLTLQGNCDERGSREYNLALGQRRAEGVEKMMELLGARASQLEATSYGEEKPRAPGHDEAAWAQNRRTDMVYGGTR